MQIRTHDNLADFESLRTAWDRLAGERPFRRWTWLSAWWRHYGDGVRGRRLHIVSACNDAGEVVAILPSYVAASRSRGRTLRLLGDGEACSEHMGVLARPDAVEEFAAVAAELLSESSHWDLVDFTAVDDDDVATAQLFGALRARGCHVTRHAGDRTWAIDLPGDWEAFLALQSKSHRKQIRQLERRVLLGDRARWRLVEDHTEFDRAWSILQDLHQRRRNSLGEPGCFASARWSAFHRDAARRLLGEGRLRLSWLELDGAPIAAEYHLAGGGATYAYQGGVDPERLSDEPGQLSTICSIQRALAEGHHQFDFLRGDEAYKPHWRATPRGVWRWQAAAPRLWPALRKRAFDGARRAGKFSRRVLGFFG